MILDLTNNNLAKYYTTRSALVKSYLYLLSLARSMSHSVTIEVTNTEFLMLLANYSIAGEDDGYILNKAELWHKGGNMSYP